MRQALLIAALIGMAPMTSAQSLEDIRAVLERGQSLKASRQAAKALESTAEADAGPLRYLLLKAHVLDLQPGKGELFRSTVGKDPDGMERYEAILAGLESDVRAEKARALPLFVTLLQQGDGLDRLLVLGLLEDMVAEAPDLAWEEASGPAGVSPGQAAAQATAAAAEDCTRHEAADPTDLAPRGDEATAEQDRYYQDVYSIVAGLGFLSRLDPVVAGRTVAVALECRGAAGWIFEDRPGLELLGPYLADGLQETLERSPRQVVKVDALLLLGRFGRCSDRTTIKRYADGDEGATRSAAQAALHRLELRLDCDS